MKSRIVPKGREAAKYPNEALFGIDVCDMVRSELGCDCDVLPDSIILADLHTYIVKLYMAFIIEKVIAGVKLSFTQLCELRQAARLFLCGSICLALASRCSVEPFKEKWGDVDWKKISADKNGNARKAYVALLQGVIADNGKVT